MIQKKKIEQFQKNGNFDKKGVDFAEISFFDETDGIDREVIILLNEKLE